jgi:hypothetical protein
MLAFEAEGQGVSAATLDLAMDEGGHVTGTLEVESPMVGGRSKSDVEGRLLDDQLELECTLTFGEVRVETSLTATVASETLDGKGHFRGPWSEEPNVQSFTGKREPK